MSLLGGAIPLFLGGVFGLSDDNLCCVVAYFY